MQLKHFASLKSLKEQEGKPSKENAANEAKEPFDFLLSGKNSGQDVNEGLRRNLLRSLKTIAPTADFAEEIRRVILPDIPRKALLLLLSNVANADLDSMLAPMRDSELARRLREAADRNRRLGGGLGVLGSWLNDLLPDSPLRSKTEASSRLLEMLVKTAGSCLNLAERKDLDTDFRSSNQLSQVSLLLIAKVYGSLGEQTWLPLFLWFTLGEIFLSSSMPLPL
jgi:hypothetical protein